MRARLLTLLAEQPGIEVIADLDRAELIMPAALASQSDVAIIDERIEGGEFVIIRTLHNSAPRCGSVIMASSHNPCRLREAVTANADGFVVKESAPEKVAETIRRVAAGRKALDPDLAFSALNIMEPSHVTRNRRFAPCRRRGAGHGNRQRTVLVGRNAP